MKPLFILISVFLIGSLLKAITRAKVSYQVIGKISLSLMFVFTGVAHFAFGSGMAAMLPELIPFKMEIIYLTGVLEILGAICLLIPMFSKITGWSLITFLVVVLPANIYAGINHIDPITGAHDGPGPEYLLFRVPLQIFYVAWIYLAAIRSGHGQLSKSWTIAPKHAPFLIFGLLAFSSCAQPNMENVSTNALEYVDSYVNMGFDELRNFYTDSSTFQDPTLTLIDKEAAEAVVGPVAILEKFKRNFNGIQQQKYSIENAFTSGDYTLLSGVFEYNQNGTAFGGVDWIYHFRLKNTTVIIERNGKIVSHTDYMDYAEWLRQYEYQNNSKED